MQQQRRTFLAQSTAVAATGLVSTGARAQSTPGVTATEIRIGSTQPLSGPASSYGIGSAAVQGVFARINEAGGIHGRKLKWLALDDGFSPPKTVEQTRKLVEQDEVFMIFAPQGTACSSSVMKYLNAKKVPQIFVSSGSHLFLNHKDAPWTVPFLPSYYGESRIYAKQILANSPNAKVGILYQNDDFGRDYLRGIRAGLGDQAAKLIISEQSYEITDATVDSQVVALRTAGCDTLVMGSLSKQSSQAIRKISDMGWKPTIYMSYISASVTPTFTGAGLEKATGVITATVIKDPTDPRWHNDKDYKDWVTWMKKYYPGGDLEAITNVYYYMAGLVLENLLQSIGPNLTRDAMLKAVTNMKEYAPPMLVPGVTMGFKPDDYSPYRRMQLQRFDGTKYVPMGQPIEG